MYIELLAAEPNDLIAFSDPYGGQTTKHTVGCRCMLFLLVISLTFQQLTSDVIAHVLHTEKSQSQTWTSIVAMILGQSYLLNNKQRTQV